MPIQNFPTALQPAIQLGYLEEKFRTGLESVLAYRSIADREWFPNKVGETITKTRVGLKAPVTTPMVPSTNTNLDNGLTPSSWTLEQYTLAINQYADTIDLNTVTQGVGIEKQFLHNAYVNGIQSGTSVDRIARLTLFNGYMGGNTRVRTTLGSTNPTISVDDIRGFSLAPVNGVMTAVSAGNTVNVTVGSNVYVLQAVTADGSNVSTAPGGVSGTLNFTTSVLVADGTALNAVTHANGPAILRPNGKSNTSALVGSDLLTMGLVLDAVALLRNNAVPTIGGMYNCYLDNKSARELFTDPDFKLLFQGATGANDVFKSGRVVELLDVRFIPTTEAYQQTLGSVAVRRPIIVGQGALVEGVYQDTGYMDVIGDGEISVVDGIAQVVRAPLDRLQQIIAQSWYYIGGFTVPSDVTANSTIIPTASNAYLKRAVVLEHA